MRSIPRPFVRPLLGALVAALTFAVTATPVAAKPLARAHRLAINLSVGFGSASLSSLHDATGPLRESFERSNPGFKFGDPMSSFQVNVEIGLRYYFPYFILAQIGYAALYSRGSAEISPGNQTLDNHNLIMEFPILVGGYYTFIDRLYVFGALGPSIFFYGNSWWDPGFDFESGAGVGMQAQLGADFMITENFSLGLDLRYRLLAAGALKVKESKTPFTPALLGKSGNEPYELDFTGISLMLNVRLFAL